MNEEISSLFKKLIESLEGTTSKTEAILDEAEERYINVSGMRALNPSRGGKGYSTGGSAERVALYTNLDWSEIDTKLSSVASGIHENMHKLIEELKESSDPDAAQVLGELEGREDLHLIRNICYHVFWLGYFTNEVGIEKGEVHPVDPDALNKERIFTPEEIDEISILVTAKAGIEMGALGKKIDQILESDSENEADEFEENYRMDCGLDLPSIRILQKRMTNASQKTIESHPELTEHSDVLNVYGMNTLIGIMIGREMERRSRQ